MERNTTLEGIGWANEDWLIQVIIALASEDGRYGYRRITVKLREAAWRVGTDRGQFFPAKRDYFFLQSTVFLAKF